jgi:hypothetical protein
VGGIMLRRSRAVRIMARVRWRLFFI